MKTTNYFAIDTHCHLDLLPQPEVTARSIGNRDIAIFAVTNTPSVFHYTYELGQRYRHVLPALGLHPELAADRHHELPIMREWIERTVVIGEIGLDYVTQDEENRAVQRKVFEDILEMCADYGDKVLTVHSRRSSKDVIKMIGNKYLGKVILHWFSGSMRDLEEALSYGFYFSVNSAMLNSKKGKNLIQHIPLQRILTETDSPFTRFQNSTASPMHIPQIVELLAKVLGGNAEAVRKQISGNFNELFSSNTTMGQES